MYDRNVQAVTERVLGGVGPEVQQETIKIRAGRCAAGLEAMNQRLRNLTLRAGVEMEEKQTANSAPTPADPSLAKIVFDIQAMIDEAHRLCDRLEIIA